MDIEYLCLLYTSYSDSEIVHHIENTLYVRLLKGAVSFRFSQGLLTLMRNNLKLKADIDIFFSVLRKQRTKVYNWLKKYYLTSGALL